RPERDAVAVGQTPAVRDARLLDEFETRLAGKTRFPASGGPKDGEQEGGLFGGAASERLAHLGELLLTPDERRVQATGERRRALDEAEQPECPLGALLERSRCERLRTDCVPDQLPRDRIDDDLALTGPPFEPQREVDGSAADQPGFGAGVGEQDLAAVDAGAKRQRYRRLCRELLVEAGD